MGGALRLPPLLLGPPGLGKTEFASRLAEALGFCFRFHSLADVSGHFVITGNSDAWSGSRPGMIATAMIECEDGKAPLILLDELDKARSDN